MVKNCIAAKAMAGNVYLLVASLFALPVYCEVRDVKYCPYGRTGPKDVIEH